jgi:hypothetical protein
MRARHAPTVGSALIALVAVAVLGAVALRPVEVLRLENPARGRALSFPLARGEPFTVTSHQSMYDVPVTEEFVVGSGGEIVLRAVSSPSAAAREYLGLTREYLGLTGAGERQAIVRTMPRVVFRVAAGPAQRLRVGAEERSFLDLGEHGDRLVLSAGRAPAAARWLALLGSP